MFVTLVTLALLLSIFLGKCLYFQEKLRKEIVRSISRQETLSRIVANAANRTEIVSPANEQYENRSKYCDITTSEQQGAQRQSSEVML